MDNGYSMIITIVNKGYSELVMNAARAAGAKGGTTINARGTGNSETQKFLGLEINAEKEIVLIVVENKFRHDIMVSIYKEAGLNTKAAGFSFSVPVDEIVGTAKLS